MSRIIDIFGRHVISMIHSYTKKPIPGFSVIGRPFQVLDQWGRSPGNAGVGYLQSREAAS